MTQAQDAGIQFWVGRLAAINRKVAAVEAGQLPLAHGERNALYDARRGVEGLIGELQHRRREVMPRP